MSQDETPKLHVDSDWKAEAQAEKEGVDNLRASGLRKVAAGITSLEEVDRVTKE